MNARLPLIPFYCLLFSLTTACQPARQTPTATPLPPIETATPAPAPTATAIATPPNRMTLAAGVQVQVGRAEGNGDVPVVQVFAPAGMSAEQGAKWLAQFDATSLGFAPDETKTVVRDGKLLIVSAKDPNVILAQGVERDGEVDVVWEFDEIAGWVLQPTVIRETPQSTKDVLVMVYGEKMRNMHKVQLDKLVEMGVWDGVKKFENIDGANRNIGYGKYLYIMYDQVDGRGFVTWIDSEDINGQPAGVNFKDMVARGAEVSLESWSAFMGQ